MDLADFDYVLPPERIAQYPTVRRRDARLLTLDRRSGALEDRGISALPQLVRAGDLVVVNDTRVIPARLFGHKSSGGAVEILIEQICADGTARAYVRASKSPPAGSEIHIDPVGTVAVTGRDGELFTLRSTALSMTEILDQSGHTPLPPYIDRPDEIVDRARYQTVYAKNPGAVAAPTAGLHLDPELLQEITDAGARLTEVTLHVGAGTFQPLRTEDLETHVMHAEYVDVSPATAESVNVTRERGGRVIAIGTTSVRALETCAKEGRATPFAGPTRLFIYPGFEFQLIDGLMTNFHLPRSTLLMLVCAFSDIDAVLNAYRYAIDHGYRFFSYGDAMWVG